MMDSWASVLSHMQYSGIVPVALQLRACMAPCQWLQKRVSRLVVSNIEKVKLSADPFGRDLHQASKGQTKSVSDF